MYLSFEAGKVGVQRRFEFLGQRGIFGEDGLTEPLSQLRVFALKGCAGHRQLLFELDDTPLRAVGAIAGGYGGVGLARKLGVKVVRATVIVIGIATAVSFFFK